MKRNRSLHDKMIERNWVLKRKRKRLPSGSELSKGKDGISTLPLESPANSASSKQRLKDDFSISQSTHKKKGNDGHYYECVICDLGGNLLCCDNCPRTYHLQCLNPPLKRTPHGKWHCPNCCEQKDSVISSTPVETVSKRARTNIITEKSKSGVKASGSRKLSLIVRASSLGKKRSSSSSKEKCAFTCISPPLEKKSVSDQMNISSGTKSTSLSSDDASAKPPSLISNKETQTSSRSMDSEPEAEIGSPLKKLILHLHRPGQKSRKNREKINKADHQKRKSKTDNGTSVGVTLEEDGSKVSSACTGMKNRRKRTSVDRQKSKEGPGMRKLVVQEYTKKPFERKMKSSNQKDEVDSKTDNVVTCEESILEAVQQVDRILGCRVQSYVANNQSTKLASDDRAVNIENARNLPGVGFDISTSHVCSEEVTEKETGVNKMDVEGISIIEECCKKADLLASTSVPVKDQSPTALKSETHTHEEAALIAVDIMDVPVRAGTTMAEESRDANDASLEARPNRTTETNVVKMGPTQTEKVVYEFLVKWVGRSHIHNTWVDESLLKVLAKRKLENYKAKYGTTVINICQEQWEQPQRVIALRNKEGIKEALVKWCGLPYDECTWERLDQPIIEEHFHLVSEFEQFESQTQVKDTLEDVSSASKGDQMEIFPLTEQPKELRGSLFPHQLEALNWLRKCWYRSKNVILADEMGLGKTVSAAAFMSSLYLEFKAKLPCLVLVPLSTMPNWVAEFVSWAPHLNVVEYHGSAKARSIIRQYEWHASNLSGPQKSKTTSYKFHVLLTTYEMVLADSNHLRGVPWAVLIVDEGHRLKNSSSKLFSLLNTFSFQHRVLLTGTPLQNNLGEMYNLLNFLQPASFPSLSCFEEKFNDLTTAEKVEELKKLVAPHMLRRLKKDAMQNIPPKTERMVPVELTSIQAEYYRAMLTKNYQVLRNIGKGVAQQSMLNIVMQLRKVCNHPYLIPGTEPESGSIEFLHEMRIKASAKLTLLHSMLKIMNKEGHRVLIFSQMTKLLDILEDYLTVEFGPKTFERVDGSVSVGDRQAAIARFNQDQSRFVFLLSTRSCGLGINLATADTVIIYDSDFNPHADIQAMNRAHRIGQSKRLLVYRLVVRASVEERILQLAKKKLMLDQLFVNKSGSQKEVEDILRWGTEELFSYLSSDRDGKNATNGTSKSIPEVGEETEQKHRRRGGGGLGDVYQDKCTDGDQRIIWDETAILRLLDRSNLDYGSTESAEADLDHDMLGSVKSLEWNDEQTEDQGAIETLPGITGDVEQTSAKKDDPVINVTEENEWDRLLRVRWEKYQNEEEASLGRGKRLRKAVSYKEVFAAHPSDALSESGNEEDEPGPEPEREVEYTPAGRALKAKYAKLRARQKERLAQRHLAEASCPVETNLAGPESVPQFHSTEGNASHIKSIDAMMDQAPQINLEDEKSSQASETIAADKNAPPSRNKGTTHVYRTIQGPRLDSSLKPPDNVSPNIFLPAHQFQNTSFGGNSMPSTIRGPILGLCAPNAYLRDSAPKTFQSYLHPQRSSSQSNESGMRIPEFPPPLAPCASTSINIGSGPESMANISALPDTSEVLHHLKSTIQDGRFSYQPCPPSTSRGRGPIDPLEVSGNRFSSFQEKMAASNLFLDEMLLPKVQFHHKNVSNSSPDLLPSLSLNMKGETMTHSIQEFPIMPLLPNFRFPFSENPKQNQHNLKEPRPVLGLGQMQPTYPSLPENHKKVLDNILMRTGAGSSKLKKRLKTEASWSEDELDTLWIGVRRHGRGNWDSMLLDPKLKFSKYRTPENLSERWEQEQLKILDGLAFPVPKPGKSTSFPCLSDGMMTRALFGSRFAGVGVPEQYGPPKFQSHLTDIQLGYGDLASSFSQLERTDHFGQMNEHLPTMPGWKHDKFRSSNSVASHAGPSDRPGSSTLPLEAPHLPNLLTDNLLQKDELCASKYLKLPTLLDRSLNWLRDSQNNKQSGESKPISLPDLGKKPSSGHSPITENASGGSSAVNKLPHWLREAVSVPSKPPEPKLPPTVSAIAQSVRLLYAEERPTIPPFTVPGPLPFRPKDPRKSLKKKKLRKLGRVTPEVCTPSSIPQVPPFPMMPTSTASSLGLPCIEPKLSLPSLNLNILNASSSASIPSNGKKSGLTLLPSPEVLHLVSSCVAPSPHLPSTSFVPDAPEMKTGFEQFELPEKIRSLDTVKGARGKRKARSSPLGSWGKFAEDPVADSTVSGDSESCGVRPEVEELSSEETLSDDQQSEPE